MKENYGKVAVLMGGNSAEREVSLKSGRAAYQALLEAGVNATAIDVDDNIMSALSTGHFERAFIALHGRGGEDGVIQGVLETLKIPYTGSGILGSAIAMNKRVSKDIWCANGFKTASYCVVSDQFSPKELAEVKHFPCVVKPVNEGSSIGMTKVDARSELNEAIATALKYDTEVMIEKWIDGGEYTVSVLGERTLPSIRIETPRVFYDYEAKYSEDTTQYFCPAGLSQADESRLQQLALRAFKALNCSGWGRVDFMRGADGAFYLLEANTVPGLTDHSLVPMAAERVGIRFSELILEILKTTLIKKV